MAACKSLGLEHRVYGFGSWMHEVIESVISTRIKDMTRVFDSYFPCMRESCMLEHVWSWMKLRILLQEEWVKDTLKRLVGVIKIE
ncbi:hypothetical protein HRbin02_00178 [Candidatus Calditenuaceae archaeon HR02]|nr:hypothetical protein HRbin02_00178 [Candidatus Calditenuaceae archaeon HR02]